MNSSSPFFITGGTLPLDAASYVARAADDELYQSLRRGEFCYVLNTRQMGKSSLMIRTARRLREDGRQVLILDLTGVGQNLTVEQWYFGLLDLAAAQTGHDTALFDFWKTHKELGAMQRFVAALRRILLAPQTPDSAVRDVVIFVDEIDAVRSLPFSADEFFAGIRECCNRNAQETEGARLTFCLLGVATPSDLIRDTRVTPFNIGRRIELHDFTREEAAPLALGLRHLRSEGEADALLERILYWTGGQPYMTQRLCRAVAEHLAGSNGDGTQDPIEETALVDSLCQRLFLTKSARESDDNLAFVRTRLLHSETDQAALLDLYGQVRRGKRVKDDETNPLCPVLRLSGVVRARNGVLLLRNEIYTRVFDAAWIAENMPDAEVRRQKRAYRLGVLRAASIAALLLIVIAGFGARAYVAEQRARAAATIARTSKKQAQEEAETSNRLLYATQMNLLQRAYQEDDIGRARELLGETEASPYRGFEWYYWNRLLKRERLAIPIGEPQSLLVWSRDGHWIVTQTQFTKETPQLSLWDARTGNLVRTLSGRTDALLGVASPVAANCVALVDAPQGKTGTVRLVNPATGEMRHLLPVRAQGATLSGDGRRVFTLEPQPNSWTLFKVWDAERGTLLVTERVRGTQLFGTRVQTPTVQSTRDSRLLCFGSALTRPNCPFTLLNTQTGERLWTPPGEYNRYALSPTGRFLVATEQEDFKAGRFQLWDVQAKRQIAALRKEKANTPSNTLPSYMVMTLGFSPDERWIAGAGEDAQFHGCVWLWAGAAGKEKRVLIGGRRVFEADFSTDGRTLFAASRDSRLLTWNTTTWQKTGVYSNDGTNSPALAPDGKEFLTVDRRAVLAYPMEARRIADKVEIAQSLKAFAVTSLGFHSDGRHLRFLSQQRAGEMSQHHIYDLQTGTQHLVPFEYEKASITLGDAAHAAKDKYPGKETRVEIRDVLTGKLTSLLHDRLPLWWMRADWPGWGTIVYDGTVPQQDVTPINLPHLHPQAILWNAETGKEVVRLAKANLRYTPWQIWPKCGIRKLILVDTENVAHFWNVSPLREIFHVPLGAETQTMLENFSVSPDDRYVSVLVADSHVNGRVEVYDLDTGKPCAHNEHALYYQPAKAFSPDRKYHAWADTQQNVHLMDVASGKEARMLKSIGGDFKCMAFSPDGTRIATGTTIGTLKLWDVQTGTELMVVRLPGELGGLAFSPDGTRLGVNVWTSGKSRSFVWEAPVLAAGGTKRE